MISIVHPLLWFMLAFILLQLAEFHVSETAMHPAIYYMKNTCGVLIVDLQEHLY